MLVTSVMQVMNMDYKDDIVFKLGKKNQTAEPTIEVRPIPVCLQFVVENLSRAVVITFRFVPVEAKLISSVVPVEYDIVRRTCDVVQTT